jgi:vacuolar protein sorting-associated protein IST1
MLDEEPPKEEKAKIRAEALIRDDNMIEAYEILQLQCELLHERIKLLDCTKECPGDLITVVSTLIWASQRVDIDELAMVRKQFRAKYGKQFEEAALRNTGHVLNERVVQKLSIQPPAAYLVQTYLERICEQFQVDWTPQVRLSAQQAVEPMAAPTGFSVVAAQGTGLGPDSHVLPSSSSDHHNQNKEDGPAGNNIPPVDFPNHLLPVVQAQPYVVPPPTTTQAPQSQPDDFAEVDIYVPPPPPAAAAANGTATSPITLDPQITHKDDQDENDDKDGGGTGNGGNANGGTSKESISTSYADLAARFQQLKK